MVIMLSVGLVRAASVTEILDQLPELSESANFAHRSGILPDIEKGAYDGPFTVLFPSNRAWEQVSETRKNYLLDPANLGDLEMLLLFSTTDSVITRSSVANRQEPIVSLLSVKATVDPTGNRICVMSRYNDVAYDCANVVEWDIKVDEGVVHIIDKVLFPEEILEVFAEMEGGKAWRRLAYPTPIEETIHAYV